MSYKLIDLALPVSIERASLMLSTLVQMEGRGWFYPTQVGFGRGELLTLSMMVPGIMEAKREWSKIFCFKMKMG